MASFRYFWCSASENFYNQPVTVDGGRTLPMAPHIIWLKPRCIWTRLAQTGPMTPVVGHHMQENDDADRSGHGRPIPDDIDAVRSLVFDRFWHMNFSSYVLL